MKLRCARSAGVALLGFAGYLVRRFGGGFSLDGFLGDTQLHKTGLTTGKLRWDLIASLVFPELLIFCKIDCLSVGEDRRHLVLELFDPGPQTPITHRLVARSRRPQLRAVQSNPTPRDEPRL